MKWIAIAGSWRKTNKKIEKDVRSEVRKILNNGGGIITGGALGVDYIATDEVLRIDPSKIKVYIPTILALYEKHYLRRAKENIITLNEAQMLIVQLKKLSRNTLFEDIYNKDVSKENYYKRISAIINNADELIAFQVNKSEGTQHTIDLAKKKGNTSEAILIYN